MKKFGQLCFCAVPILLVFVIEYLVTFFFMGIVGLTGAIYCFATGTGSFSDTYMKLFDLIVTSEFGTYTMVMYAIISIVLYALWYYSQYEGELLPHPRKNFSVLSLLGILMLVPGMQYFSSYLVSFLAALFPGWLETYMDLMESAGMDTTITFGIFLYSVILAPFAEELICRGVTLRQAKKVLPFWAANLLQAFLFGVLHMNMIQGSYAFCLGLILGFICEKSGTIYASILLHILFNFWGTVISEYITFGETAFSFLFFFFFGLALTIGGIMIFGAGIPKKTNQTVLEQYHYSA